MSAADLSPATPERPARRSWLDRWFGPVQVPPEVVAELRELSRRGSLAFVMRSSGMLNFLFVRWWVRRLGLPPLRASVGSDWLIPTFFGVRRSRRALDEAISRGHTSVVFLNTHHDGHDPFAALCGRQRTLSHPVFLVPLLLVWSRRAQRLKPPVWELLYGSPEAPTAIGVAVAFLRYYRRAFLRVGSGMFTSSYVVVDGDLHKNNLLQNISHDFDSGILKIDQIFLHQIILKGILFLEQVLMIQI